MTTSEQPENPPPSSADAPPPPKPRRRRLSFVRHRTTQLIAVMVLGLAIGAGISALASHQEGGGDNREHSHQADNENQQEHVGEH